MKSAFGEYPETLRPAQSSEWIRTSSARGLLRFNSIDAEGTAALAEAMRTNHSIRELDVRGNDLGKPVGKRDEREPAMVAPSCILRALEQVRLYSKGVVATQPLFEGGLAGQTVLKLGWRGCFTANAFDIFA